jgi:tetratricopeptide (TPR) repeat protein
MKDFFISYNQADRQWAEWIAWALEEEGYSTVLQAWDFRPGCNFPLEMHKAIKETERIIIVLSQDFLNSDFTAPEWAAVFAQDPTGAKGKILPIKVRECRPDGLLAPINRIDLIGLNQEEAKRVLLAGVSRERAKPENRPDFPGSRSVPSQPLFPGELPERGHPPPGYRVPFSPNAVFTGRQEYLTDLADILLHPGKDSAADAGVVVIGIGGVGKSQLAVEFCYRYGRFFQGVHWIQANLNISAEVAECGLAMGLPGWPDKLPEQVAATIRAWQEGGRRLIVLDNAERLEPLQEWMPKLQSCRLLITSRRDNWPVDLGLQTKRLDELTRTQSIELLRKLSPRLQKIADDELGELAKHLGDLPLALDLAGRYLEDRAELSIQEYLTELEAAGNALEHTSLKDWVEHNPTNHSTSLAATFSLSWDQLGEADELASLLFRIGGYCASNTPIPRGLLAKAIEARGSDQELDRALRKLESLGLMQPADGGRRMHTLLAEFARLLDRDAKESALPALAKAMVGLTTQAIESGLPERMVSLREHLDFIARATEKAKLQQTGALWNNLGNHLWILSEYEGARSATEKALKIDKKVFGPDHPHVAIRINNLGMILRYLGDLQEAKNCFERALRIDEKVYGQDHPQVAIFVNNLGLVLRDLGDLMEAKNCFTRALRIDSKTFGHDHPNVASDVNNLGSVLQALGKLQEARKCYERALRIDEKVYGQDHPQVAIFVNNLGSVLQDLGELQEARGCYNKALKIDEKVYGADHPVVARDVNNLGSVLQALGELQGARECFERALKIDEKVYGPDHPNVARDVNNLGSVLQALGELQGARECFERALKIGEKIYGPDHPRVAIRVNNLGGVLQTLGEMQEARKCFERALRICRQKLGEDHPTTKRIKRNLESLDS